ncbi:tetratricopeptide repeat protein [Flavobacterium terrigena]|nr:tetratricopeptide repeat protein [Flavobacterium terrigena]
MKKVLIFSILFLSFGCKSDSETQILELNKKLQNFTSKEKFEDAIKVLDEIEKIDPNYKSIHGSKAVLYLKANKFVEAKTEINKELKKDSLNDEVWLFNGIISRELNDKEYSNLCFKKSIKIYESGKSNSFKNENDLDQMKFLLLHVINDNESKIKKEQLKTKWKVDYKMMNHFKFIESETPKKALEMLYK